MAGHPHDVLQEATEEFKTANEAAKKIINDVAVLAHRLSNWNPESGHGIQNVMGEACGDGKPVSLADWPTTAKIEETLAAHTHARIKQRRAQDALNKYDEEERIKKLPPMYKTAKT